MAFFKKPFYTNVPKTPSVSTPCIDMVIPTNQKHQRRLERYSYVLNHGNLNKLQLEKNFPIGRLGDKNGTQLAVRMAYRITKRLAKQFSPNNEAEVEAFASAWHFTMWAELCAIIPIRKLVRHIIQEADGRQILLPIDPNRTDCLCWFGTNQVEPFVLAHELAKRDQKVFLLANWRFHSNYQNENESIKVHFYASPAFWEPPGSAKLPNWPSNELFCPDHVRYPEYIQRYINAQTVMGDSLDPRPYDDFLLRDNKSFPEPLTIKFKRQTASHRFVTLVPAEPMPNLVDGFLSLLGAYTRDTWKNAQTVVEKTGAKIAHISDLLMFDTALVAHAIAKAGGKLHIWPHSTNGIILPYHKTEYIGKTVAMTKTTQKQWQKYLGRTDVDVVSQIMLNKPAVQRPFESEHGVSVVFFGGAAKCGRMPAVDFHINDETMHKLFAELNALPDHFRLFIKTKYSWETKARLNKFIPKGSRFQYTEKTTAKLNFPNMVYVTSSFGSSALLEGMCKGIPGFVARETPVVDYIPVTEERGQVGDVAFIIDQIKACANEEHYTKVAAQNIEWMRTETNFPDDLPN